MRLDPLHFWLVVLVICIAILALACLLACQLPLGSCMTLEISGHSFGQGYQNLSFAGDFINVSIQQNSSWQGWNVTLGANST